VRKSNNPSVRCLEVKSRFEPSHVAAECLAQAYERRVPLLRRQVTSHRPLSSLPNTLDERQIDRRRS
jgi:hypothetical protein